MKGCSLVTTASRKPGCWRSALMHRAATPRRCGHGTPLMPFDWMGDSIRGRWSQCGCRLEEEEERKPQSHGDDGTCWARKGKGEGTGDLSIQTETPFCPRHVGPIESRPHVTRPPPPPACASFGENDTHAPSLSILPLFFMYLCIFLFVS